jgi:pyruvate dehydrogenase E1 component alpha subunit
VTDVDAGFQRHLLREMIRIRRFEEKSIELYQQEKIRGFLHVYIGEEAVAVGVMQALTEHDSVLATHREHGHALARGVSMRSAMAEMFGRVEGCSMGRGGSMHLFDKTTRFYGGSAIVASALPVAVGLALADKLRKRPAVTAVFFGEGAIAEGEFHESLNLAALWRLPVLFCCENNVYGMGTAVDRALAVTDLCERAKSYGVEAATVDGMDVLAVSAAAETAVQAIRDTERPYFLEHRTYRFRGHSMFDPERYRSSAEVDEWRGRDPIARLSERMISTGTLAPRDLDSIDAAAMGEVEDAVAFADAGLLESEADLTRFVYSEATHA